MDEGALVEFVGFARVITEGVVVYKSLQRIKEALQLTLDGSSMGIFQ